jgi:tripartite-type tricarboxylate transporter receptor subunit TctC
MRRWLARSSLALLTYAGGRLDSTALEWTEREKAEMKLICAFVATLTALLGSHGALAQSAYPDKAIRILVGFPPGGPPDIAARLLADKFAEAWGKPVLVENATGAGGNVAVDRAAKAAPDGYTLVMASSAITINVSLYEKLPYDPVKDLAPISLVVFTPSVLVVHSDMPAKNVQELVALARAQPGKLTYGHAGVGTPSHLSAELFKSVTGVNIQPVPYRGIPSLLPDLLAGRVTMTLPNMSVVLPLVREGKLRALMAMAPTRPAALPHVPTLAQAGFTGFDTTVWFGLMAPAGTPQPIIDKLYSETARVLAQNDVRNHLQGLGMEIVANAPPEFAAMIKSEIPQWAKLIKDAGISVNE